MIILELCVLNCMYTTLQRLEKGAVYLWTMDFAYVKGSLIRFVSLVMPMKVFSLCSCPPSPLLSSLLPNSSEPILTFLVLTVLFSITHPLLSLAQQPDHCVASLQ